MVGLTGPVFAAVQVEPITSQALVQAIEKSQRPVTVVNIWATWCKPCVEEFPELVRLRSNFKDQGVEVLFVSANFKNSLPDVERFLEAHQVTWPSYLKDGPDDAFIEGFSPDWSGAIPATFVFNAQGALTGFHRGKGDYALFEQMIYEALER